MRRTTTLTRMADMEKEAREKRSLVELHRGNSSFSVGSSVSDDDWRQDLLWVRIVWTVHFLLGLFVMYLGILANGRSRKYIPVNPEKLGEICERAFLNVMAPSGDEEGALVCCDGFSNSTMSDICPSETSAPPLANAISRFPQAWLLPLFPLLLRIAYRAYDSYTTNGRFLFDASLLPAFRRLGYYTLLLNIRGWILYLGFNQVEDMIVKPIDEDCWYRDWLRDDQAQCTGRVFDFSDHIVLYFAQILPIALIEFLYAFQDPYWPTDRSRPFDLGRWIPKILIGGMLYIYFITYLGVYKTAAYFHTASECYAGFVVSLSIHVPVCCIQCSDYCENMRNFLFHRKTTN